MNMATANTYWTANYTGGNNKIAISFCLTLPTSASNVMDIVSIQDASGFTTWLQIGSGATTMDLEVTPSPTTGPVAVTPGATYWVTMIDDESAGTASFAVYQPYYPYAQVGTTQSHSQTTSSSITAVRFGNAEVGTSSSTMYMENLILDSTNAKFPLIPNLATPWAPVVTPTRAIDWSKAGVTGGIPTRSTICTTLGTAGQAPSFVQSVTAAQIISAINACAANGVVLLNPGTYNLTGQVTFTAIQNVTLRGSGADQTLLVFSGVTTTCGTGLPTAVCVRATDGNYSGGPTNTANWTAGYLKGNTTITLSAVANLKVGHYIILDQLDDTAFGCDSGKVLVTDITTTCTSGSPTSPGINGPYSGDGNGGGARTGRGQQQIVQVTQCDGNSTVGHTCASGSNMTISPPLYQGNWNWSPGNNLPQAWWATAPPQGVGIENLTVDNTSNGANTNGCSGGVGIGFYNAIDSWMTGVRDIDSVKAHVEFNWSAHISALNNYIYLTQNAGSTGGTSGSPTGCAYGFESFAASDVLVQNNITQGVATPYILNGPCDGCVFSYNFSVLDLYLGTPLYASNTQGDHDAGNSNVLIEGNIGGVINADDTHGTHNLITYFRNQWVGPQTCWQSSGNVSTTVLAISTGTFSACTQNISPIVLNSFSRFFNLVGNILGTTGTNTTYQNTGSQPIYDLGNGNASYGTAADVNTTNTVLRWGNCDSSSGFGACRFVSGEVPSSLSNQGQSFFANPVPANNTLSASFYLTTKPSWWSSKPWPGIGPDVTGGNVSGVGGLVYTNPAADCYLNTMGGPANGVGTVLTFNANTCYNASGPAVGFSPSSLSFGNQVVSTPSPTQNITLTNTGSSTLTISSISVTGTNAADFGQTNGCGGSLGAGSQCFIVVTFTPSIIGAESASVSVSDNASGSPQTVPLSGTGVTVTPPVSVTPIILGSLPSGTVGTSYSGELTVTNNTPPDTWSVNPNIPGLALAAGTGVLSGTPTTAGTYNLTFTVVDSYVCGPTDPPGCSNTSAPYPTTVTIANAAPVSVSISPLTASIVTGATKQFTSTVTGSTNTAVTWTTSNGTVSATGLYTAPSLAGASTVTATSVADATKSASATVTITASTSTYVLNPTPTSFTFTAAGSQNITVHDSTPGSLPLSVASDSSWIVVCLTNTTGTKIPKVCTSGTASIATATTATGTVAVSATGLPSGVHTGHIIITAGSESGGVTVNNSPYSIPVTFTVAGPPTLVISTSSLSAGTSGTAYSATLAATGGTSPYTWGGSGLPPGLTQSGATISGTPTASGTFTVTETVTDSSSPVMTASKIFTVTIAAPPSSMTTTCAWLADGVTWQCNTLTANMPAGMAIKSVVTSGTLTNTNTGTHP